MNNYIIENKDVLKRTRNKRNQLLMETYKYFLLVILTTSPSIGYDSFCSAPHLPFSMKFNSNVTYSPV
jgi:hypothetical protein